ncbi:Cof-type HAD-IIB family hydrolase [Tetragenococcus halophilus]|uniref:HAD family hydrolase n=1 Tax=Tetragenococcus halophilus TaxID=51669 RepID=UPI00102FD5E3|nr:HAD family hydrolase [Tetragenococcus halophilus]GFK23747.1 haloacid dehalogenase [Tetragenococcus halophilus]GMG61916.1 Cof-type HAD-IIB family hydrolase [Tetragenococcus halophilus]GMQ73380.1 Cof-type HAD-IIB family hydrolase [Tetragenococcus halophilus]
MKLLVSDFDGTLYQNNNIGKDTQLKIKRWQNAGHYFVIATERDLPSLLEKINAYDLSPDFIIGNNGATINQKVLSRLDKSVYRSLAKRVINNKSIFQEVKVSYIIEGIICSKKAVIAEMNSEELQRFFYEEQVIQFSVKSYSVQSAAEFAKNSATDFSKVSFLKNIETIDLVDVSVNKLFTIQQLIKELGIPDTSVITIGDGLNDLQMINKYQSATFPWVDSTVKKTANYQVCNVGEFIKQVSYEL